MIPDFVLTSRTAGLAIVAGVGLLLPDPRGARARGRRPWTDRGSDRDWYRSIGLTGAAVALGLVIVSLLPDAAILTLTSHPGGADRAARGRSRWATSRSGSSAARDPRRYVIGFVAAAVGWFAILYPNIAALPLPAARS